ncbi:hypothetical protein IAT38_002797 [Cryptococcus sp. DSM 104549]
MAAGTGTTVTILNASPTPSPPDSPATPTPSFTLTLTDEELWAPFFAYPSISGMTLHRWALTTQAELIRHTNTLPPSPSPTQYTHLLTLSRSATSSTKILVLGSILLLRGVNHGPQMGGTLFGRTLGERYNDLMTFREKETEQGGKRGRLVDDERCLRESVGEARKLQARANLLFSESKYEAALEHFGMALVKLIPWDAAALSTALARSTGFTETDQSLLLSIALTSLRIAESLTPTYRSHLSIPGSRLYRLTQAACDYVRGSCVGVRLDQVGEAGGEGGRDEDWMMAEKLERVAARMAGVPDTASPGARGKGEKGKEGREEWGWKTPRGVRRGVELGLGLGL